MLHIKCVTNLYIMTHTQTIKFTVLHTFTNFLQTLQVKISHCQCPTALIEMAIGQAIVIDGKVYYGGGVGEINHHEFVVQCYERTRNTWSLLPKTAVRRFGMGHINGQLVLVGGTKQNFTQTSTVSIYSEHSNTWIRTIPPMPTARSRAAVVSIPTHLVVAGGTSQTKTLIHAVEIYNIATSQWSTTDQLPYGCWDLQATTCNNIIYLMGGYDIEHRLNKVLSANVADLISNSIREKAPQNADNSLNPSNAWREIQNTPSYRPSTVTMASVVLAAGGVETADLLQILPTQRMHAYSSSMNAWVYVGDLPASVAFSAFVPISQTEFLTIGGRDANWYMRPDTYKITFNLTI